MNNQIIVITGKSAVGKDTIAKILVKKYGYKFVVSTTSRPIRPKESENNPYHFISRKQFKNIINNNDLIEYREYKTFANSVPDTWYYGVLKNEIDLSQHSYVAVLDIIGLKAFKKYFKNNVISFYIDADDITRERRAILRDGFDKTEWNRRLEDDTKVFAYNIIKNEVDYTIENYNLNDCICSITSAINECQLGVI